jgi:hypothetical protein
MKYYLYISDAKVDMLYPQVPHELTQKTSTEYGFDVKILSGKRKNEWTSDENRISRLEAVLSFIRTYGNVGTVDDPDEYIDDTQPMWFGNYTPQDIAYFTGVSERTVFGLSGSGKHLVGADPNPSPWSNGTRLIEIFGWLSEQNPTRDENAISAVPLLAHLAAISKRPKQRLEFLAKRLVYQPHFEFDKKKINVLLATPLYVAMTD